MAQKQCAIKTIATDMPLSQSTYSVDIVVSSKKKKNNKKKKQKKSLANTFIYLSY